MNCCFKIRDGEPNMGNGTVKEETFGSVQDRIAGFNKESDMNYMPFSLKMAYIYVWIMIYIQNRLIFL